MNFFVQTSPQSQNVTSKKLPKRGLHEKFVRKTLMKLTPGCHKTHDIEKKNNSFTSAAKFFDLSVPHPLWASFFLDENISL